MTGKRSPHPPRVDTAAGHVQGFHQKPATAGGSNIDNLRARIAFLVSVFRRWAVICIPVGVFVGAGVGAFVCYTYQPVYRATAWLLIEDRRPVIVSGVKAQADSTKFVQNQIQLITSPLVLGQALKEREVTQLAEIQQSDSPLDWLIQQLRVTSVGGSDYYKIDFDAPDASAAAVVANTVAKAYIELHSQSDSKDTQHMLELLDQEQERGSKEIERLQERVRVLAKRVTGKDPMLAKGGKNVPVVVSAVSANQDEDRLASAEVERQQLEVRLQKYSESLAKRHVEIPSADIDAAVAARKEIVEMRAAVDALSDRIKQLVRVSAKGANDPKAIEWNQELVVRSAQLKEWREKLRKEVGVQLETAELQKRETAVAALKEQISEKKGMEELFRQRIDVKTKEREALSDQELELENAREDLSRTLTIYQQTRDKAKGWQTEMRAPPRVMLHAPAIVPAKPNDPNRLARNLILFVMAAFALPWGLAILWEGFVRHVVEAEDLEQASGISVLGEIAALPARPRFGQMNAKKFEQHQELYEESIDALRTSLVVSDEMKNVKVLAVASAVSSEGKTSLASQLAVSLARSSRALTLLIDADMRAPDMHTIFEIPNDKGLADVLDGKCTAQEAIATNWDEHLHIMPAGRLRRSPYVLLANGQLDSLLAELRATYRYIVIDGPPVLSASEAMVIAKAADGTVLCTMRERTRAPQVKLARQRLAAAGVRLLGAVLAGVPARSYAYKYGGYYYYGSRGDGDGETHHSNGNGASSGNHAGPEADDPAVPDRGEQAV